MEFTRTFRYLWHINRLHRTIAPRRKGRIWTGKSKPCCWVCIVKISGFEWRRYRLIHPRTLSDRWNHQRLHIRPNNFYMKDQLAKEKIYWPFLGAFCGYGWDAFFFGRGGGTCSLFPLFWIFRKYFWAWLRICQGQNFR